ncbi:MAG: hypothetical protein N0E37_05755 [Candidatus Thiodiazotropha taylori]|nr:hypothetical protein [Candidatus Thiodiazotropha taylori]MCG7896647.1 hypothetical protein [Candidatus Thiodiazotropha taylori]MCG7908926.1 hypothetical protein [Candidatus Thiodiazotropha taylori]MCG7917243.1 hypothetical protein [Candidatus Thiodiazotropha taylori]MCG7942583.1 hypothetical protein [Candidatus Thiodiazotropha taylori]
MSQLYASVRFIAVLLLAVALTSCTAGDSQFTAESPAGFFWGLWHGVISVISLVIHLFNDNVVVYEVDNSGGWYDFGFLLGVIMVWGGGCHASCKTKQERESDQEWDEIGDKVEKKVMRRLKAWAEEDESTGSDGEWEEISEKVEKKLKRKIREWAEKD